MTETMLDRSDRGGEGEGELHLRHATLDDAERLRRWRNDRMTRRMVKSQQKVGWEEHVDWLRSVVADDDRILWIAEAEGEPVGRFRADYLDGEVVLTWAVAPDHRRKGYGTALVREGVRLVRQAGRGDRMTAEIRIENEASKKIAKRAGMKREQVGEEFELWVAAV